MKMKDCRVPACRRERSKSSRLYHFVRRQHSAHNIVHSHSLKGFVWGLNKPLLHNGKRHK
ncbi:hypothetical protein FDH48_gp63 [Arthrobacter phage Jawnski]|uniref:Uncharacterized protein n=1 Tax=Arthrobacter phage Jawnski TaxID=1772327 RepID=A0A0U4B3S5_9CAUD|nr:hypothetical protein FDH48_gp63 [Arthrobacter phage Jawnski]ALY09392.1 hypothetical protein JAWNSKI_63 [Arthrobacter phage Jawnski]